MKKENISKLVVFLFFAIPIGYIIINNAIVKKKEEAHLAKIEQIESKYTVIKKDKYPRMSKVSYTIRLHKECTEDEIKEIALYLRHFYPYQDRVFIEYYLEGMDIDDFAWATSHFKYGNMEINMIHKQLE